MPVRHYDHPLEMTRGSLFAGRFEVRDELGSGGMAVVYRVWDRRNRNEVALKVAVPEDSAAAVTAERFEREFLLGTRIDHPLVVRPLEYGRTVDALWFTMELFEGESLRSVVRRDGGLSAPVAFRLLRLATEALAAAHDAGVLHRDIKTGNFLVSHDRTDLRLIDFGIARSLEHAALGTDDEALEGSPVYIPPERFAGMSETERSDLYALGATAFEMLTGRPPFAGSDLRVICANVLTADTPRARATHREVPIELDLLVGRLLSKRPIDRPRSCAALRRELASIRRSMPPGERAA